MQREEREKQKQEETGRNEGIQKKGKRRMRKIK